MCSSSYEEHKTIYGGSAGAEVFGIFGGDVDYSQSGYDIVKNELCQHKESKTARKTSAFYLSRIADKNVVDAWENCMIKYWEAAYLPPDRGTFPTNSLACWPVASKVDPNFAGVRYKMESIVSGDIEVVVSYVSPGWQSSLFTPNISNSSNTRLFPNNYNIGQGTSTVPLRRIVANSPFVASFTVKQQGARYDCPLIEIPEAPPIPTTSSFEGVFHRKGGACETPNPVTGSCTCVSKGAEIVITGNPTHGASHAGNPRLAGELVFCKAPLNNTDFLGAGYAFGQSFTPVPGTDLQGACPAGTRVVQDLTTFGLGSQASLPGGLTICYGESGKRFGGISYSENSCLSPNILTGDCGCPIGYDPYDVAGNPMGISGKFTICYRRNLT